MSKSKSKAAAPVKNFVRKDFEPKDILKITEEINGMPKGTLVEVKAVQFDGAVFVVDALTGPKAESEQLIRIRAEELILHKRHDKKTDK